MLLTLTTNRDAAFLHLISASGASNSLIFEWLKNQLLGVIYGNAVIKHIDMTYIHSTVT